MSIRTCISATVFKSLSCTFAMVLRGRGGGGGGEGGRGGGGPRLNVIMMLILKK